MKSPRLQYVMITAARNEAAFIELTIQSMLKQTARPFRWVIVSDGSTDGTDEIVRKHAAQHEWIHLLRMSERTERHFGGKAVCFNAGYEQIKGLSLDIIGNLDADLSFEGDVMAFLLEKFANNPKLGVAGVPFTEGNGTYDFRFSSVEHVSGACQMFRRECFEAIGGYVPIKGGGIDLVAVVTARMKGWETRSFPERACFHHRKMGTGMNRGFKLPFKWGQSDYRLGGHPVWELFRCLYQMKNKPFILGGLICLTGYYYALMAGHQKSVTDEFARFRGQEQMNRLRSFWRRTMSFGKRRKQNAAPCSSSKPA